MIREICDDRYPGLFLRRTGAVGVVAGEYAFGYVFVVWAVGRGRTCTCIRIVPALKRDLRYLHYNDRSCFTMTDILSHCTSPDPQDLFPEPAAIPTSWDRRVRLSNDPSIISRATVVAVHKRSVRYAWESWYQDIRHVTVGFLIFPRRETWVYGHCQIWRTPPAATN